MTYLITLMLAASPPALIQPEITASSRQAVAPPQTPAPPPVVAPTTSVRALTCTAGNREVRQLTIDVTGKRWREPGKPWTKMARLDDDMIVLKRERGKLADFSREDVLDRATLTLRTKIHAGLIDDTQIYRCEIGPALTGASRL